MTPTLICLMALGLSVAVIIIILIAKSGGEDAVNDRLDIMRANITTLDREIMNLELRLSDRLADLEDKQPLSALRAKQPKSKKRPKV